jgi:hypothetical protein
MGVECPHIDTADLGALRVCHLADHLDAFPDVLRIVGRVRDSRYGMSFGGQRVSRILRRMATAREHHDEKTE